MERDLYDILGVSSDADTADIKSAYRGLARKYHPDVNPDDPEAEDKFKSASAAFEVLSDPEKRKLYDEFGFDGLREGFDADQARKYQQWQQQAGAGGFGAGGGGGRRVYRTSGGAGFEDIFGDIFGGGRGRGGGAGQSPFGAGFAGAQQAPLKGRDVTTTLNLDFRRAIEGGQVEFSLRGQSLKVRIPKGVREGERLRLKGKGQPAPTTPYGEGQPGDLLLKISVGPHPSIRREDMDLYMDVPITIPEAVEGTKVNVPTPWGEYTVTIPEGVHSGAKLRLKGQGVHRGDKKGNFYVIVQIRTPDRLDDEVKEQVRSLEDAYVDDVRAELRWD